MFTFEIDGNVSSFTTTDRNTAWDLYGAAASDAETVTMREDGEVIATFEATGPRHDCSSLAGSHQPDCQLAIARGTTLSQAGDFR